MVPYKQIGIAGIRLELQTEIPLERSESFREFEIYEESLEMIQYTVTFKSTDQLPEIHGAAVYKNFRFQIYQLEDGSYCRLFFDESEEHKAYAVTFFKSAEKQIAVFYLKEKEECLNSIQKAFLYIGWEWILKNEKMLILHASYLKTAFGGLAFSGPSGIGKSTQADLWCRYGDAQMLNGDKIILRREGNVWKGYGSPYAGSSQCYVNDSCRLTRLVFLKQGKECSLRRLNTAESFRRIYSGLTVNYWDRTYVEAMCDLAQRLAEEIPAYEFCCTPEEKAVAYLKEKMISGGEDVTNRKS